jgi:hypothetical protein
MSKHKNPPQDKPSKFTAAERRHWQQNMLRFARAASGVCETFIVPAQARGRLMLAVLCREPTAIALAQAITSWMEMTMRPGARVLCLNCDTAFNSDVAPTAYAVSLPFADHDLCDRDGHLFALRRTR